MTANDVFALAAGYLAQSVEDSEDLAAFVPGWLSVLLAESLPTENQLRRYEGADELLTAPVVSAETMDEELPYHDSILRTALPYGLASDFYRDDDNDYRCQDFRARYIAALEDVLCTRSEAVRDVY